MKKTKILFTTISLITIFLLGFTVSNAQKNKLTNSKSNVNKSGWSQTNYQVYLKAIVGTDNSTSNKKASKMVSNLIEELDDEFSYQNYELLFSSYQKVANRGYVQSSNILDGIGGLNVEGYPISVNWNLGTVEHRESYENYVKFNSFTFTSQDVPIKVNSKIEYRTVKYTIKQLRVNLEKPTVIGSLSVPQTDETLFFIVTVNKVNN